VYRIDKLHVQARLTPSLQVKVRKVLVIIRVQNGLGLAHEPGSHVRVGLSLNSPDNLGHLGRLHVVRGQGVGDLLDLLRVSLQELAVLRVIGGLELVLEVVVVDTGRHIVGEAAPVRKCWHNSAHSVYIYQL
jgi:hypothetical protein